MPAPIRRSLVGLLAVTASLAASVCVAAQTPASPPRDRDAGPDGSVDIQRQPAVVTLKNPGDEPRRIFRYQLKPGVRQRAELKHQISSSAGGVPRVPPSVTTLAGEITTVKEGRATYGFLISEARMEKMTDDPAEILYQIFAEAMVGATGTITIDNQGRLSDSSLKPRPTADPGAARTLSGIADAIKTVAVLLPDDAVGVGAQWDVERKSTTFGVTSTTVHSYTLTRLDEDGFEADFVISGSARDQDMDLGANAPPGVKVRMLSTKTSGSGKVSVRRDRPLPLFMTSVQSVENTAQITTTDGQRETTQTGRAILEIRDPKSPVDEKPATPTPTDPASKP